MKLFTVGPVDMYDETLEIGGQPIPYFRTKEFSQIMFDIENKFLKLIYAPKGAKLVTLTASGTGAMESVVENVLYEKDKVLVIDGGSFGHRFVQLCEIHNIQHDIVKLKYGQVLTSDIMEKYDNKGYTALLVNIDETSTGQLYDYKMLGAFCHRNNMLYLVDAVSSFLADELKMEDAGIDVVVTASQKALALPPGLAFAVLSPRVINERVNVLPVKSMYFNYKDYLKNMERGQTPFTPAVGIVFQLKQRIDSIYEKGVESEIEHHRVLASKFRKMCDENDIKYADFPMSNALTTIEFKDNNATVVFEKIREKYDITITPSGGVLADKVLRVGHLGKKNLEDYEELIKYIKEVM